MGPGTLHFLQDPRHCLVVDHILNSKVLVNYKNPVFQDFIAFVVPITGRNMHGTVKHFWKTKLEQFCYHLIVLLTTRVNGFHLHSVQRYPRSS